MDLARQKYNQHRHSAKNRGIEFDLTFEEWKSIWGQHLGNRGRAADQLGMLRTRDEGGYSTGNVRLGSPKENQQERRVAEKVKSAQNWNMSNTQYALKPPAQTSWVRSRGYVFDEYVEDDE